MHDLLLEKSLSYGLPGGCERRQPCYSMGIHELLDRFEYRMRRDEHADVGLVGTARRKRLRQTTSSSKGPHLRERIVTTAACVSICQYSWVRASPASAAIEGCPTTQADSHNIVIAVGHDLLHSRWQYYPGVNKPKSTSFTVDKRTAELIPCLDLILAQTLYCDGVAFVASSTPTERERSIPSAR
jgi:hypothetical protein